MLRLFVPSSIVLPFPPNEQVRVVPFLLPRTSMAWKTRQTINTPTNSQSSPNYVLRWSVRPRLSVAGHEDKGKVGDEVIEGRNELQIGKKRHSPLMILERKQLQQKYASISGMSSRPLHLNNSSYLPPYHKPWENKEPTWDVWNHLRGLSCGHLIFAIWYSKDPATPHKNVSTGAPGHRWMEARICGWNPSSLQWRKLVAMGLS